MLAGADENPQPRNATEPGPRHLRSRRGRHAARLHSLLLHVSRRRGAAAVIVLAIAALGLTALPDSDHRPTGAATAGPEPSRSAADVASRNHQRAPASASAPAPGPTKVTPVGGLSQLEMDNAVAIIAVARRERLPKRAAVVALATALQESHLRNLANANLPTSLEHPNQGVGYDYDSVGLFQQRPNWGSVEQLMNPQESARRFYAALLSIPAWGDYAVTVAAQMVQGSAFPDAYAKWEGLANTIADAAM